MSFVFKPSIELKDLSPPELQVRPLMLLKHPTCLETIKRMRAYVGNTPSWELSESAALVFSRQAHRIRKQADALYKNMKVPLDCNTTVKRMCSLISVQLKQVCYLTACLVCNWIECNTSRVTSIQIATCSWIAVEMRSVYLEPYGL